MCSVGAELLLAGGWTDFIVALRNFANASKNWRKNVQVALSIHLMKFSQLLNLCSGILA